MKTSFTSLHYEVLGRLMGALFDSGGPGVMQGQKDFYFWNTAGGGISLSWEEGPHAYEVVEYLQALCADNEWTRVLEPGDLTNVELPPGAADPLAGPARFLLRGVRIMLRPGETIGVEEASARVWARLRRERTEIVKPSAG